MISSLPGCALATERNPDPLWIDLLDQLRSGSERTVLSPILDELRLIVRSANTLRVTADVDKLTCWRRDGLLFMLDRAVSEATHGSFALALLPTRGSLDVDPTQTLGAFIPSPSNQATRSRLRDLIDGAGSYPGLVMLCGPEGAGKTHALRAIANGVTQRTPPCRALCVDADGLSLALATSLRQGALDCFREELTDAEVFLLDAVDRLREREDTQLELLNGLDRLMARPGLVVLTARSASSGLDGLAPALRERLATAIALELAPPRFETRVAIALDRASAWELGVRPEVAALLVQHAGDGLLDLDVLITRLAVHPALATGLLDVELVRHVLGEELRRPTPLSSDTVLDIVTRHFAVRGAELRAQARTPRVSTPRQIAMYLLREHCDLSYPQIGRVLRRHHTTVMHGCQRIADLREANPGLGATVSMLEKELSRLREPGG